MGSGEDWGHSEPLDTVGNYAHLANGRRRLVLGPSGFGRGGSSPPVGTWGGGPVIDVVTGLPCRFAGASSLRSPPSVHGLDGRFAQIHGQGGRTVGAEPCIKNGRFSVVLSGKTLDI